MGPIGVMVGTKPGGGPPIRSCKERLGGPRDGSPSVGCGLRGPLGTLSGRFVRCLWEGGPAEPDLPLLLLKDSV